MSQSNKPVGADSKSLIPEDNGDFKFWLDKLWEGKSREERDAMSMGWTEKRLVLQARMRLAFRPTAQGAGAQREILKSLTDTADTTNIVKVPKKGKKNGDA